MIRRAFLARKPFRKPSLEELKEKGLLTTANKLVAKTPIRKRAKSNKGWVDVARAIWNEDSNEHCCEVCGDPLGGDFSPTFFHHLLHRNAYRHLRREPRNMAQVCATCHSRAHRYGPNQLAETKEIDLKERIQWERLSIRMGELRDIENGITDEATRASTTDSSRGVHAATVPEHPILPSA